MKGEKVSGIKREFDTYTQESRNGGNGKKGSSISDVLEDNMMGC